MSGPGVVFNYQNWIAAFPQFAAVNAAQAQSYFDYATLYFNNCGWPGSLPQAPTLLNLLTAHVAWLWAPRDENGNPSSTGTFQPPALIGRVTSASQGSVSVQTEYEGNGGSPSAAWFLQSTWGASYWAATAQFRTARYVAQPTVVVQGTYPSGPYGWYGRNIF